MRTLNIACATDEGYVQHCGVMLCSLLENNTDVECRVFVISDWLSATSRTTLDGVVRSRGHRIHWLTLEPERLSVAPVFGHVSLATYFRLLLPDQLPPDVDKVLFLDSDIVVRSSVSELYDTPIEEYTHAAVVDPGLKDTTYLRMPPGAPYFNAGVLLINVDRWRREKLMQTVLRYIAEHRTDLVWWDQDALNAVLCGRWTECHPRWNAQEAFYRVRVASKLGVSEEDLLELLTNPRIVHFSGTAKPWDFGRPHPFRADYYKYLEMTPWRGYKARDRRPLTLRAKLLVANAAPRVVWDFYERMAARRPLEARRRP